MTQPHPNIIVHVDLGSKELHVVRQAEVEPAAYDVIVDGVIRHPNSSAEDVMRALGNYIQSLSHQLEGDRHD